MNATVSGLPRALRVLLGPLAALGLLLSVQGCSTSAAATTVTPGPTPASALQVYNAFVTTEKVALVNHDELLAVSLLTGSQYTIAQAAYYAAVTTGHPVTGPVYGKPTLYVPKLITYPQWFMAEVPEHPDTGGAEQTELLVFDRPDAETIWALSGSAVLNQGAPALGVAVDSAGYATALATSDPKPKLRPDIVGAMHATVADDGPSSAAAVAVAPGPETTELYQVNAALARQAAAQHNVYTWALEGTSYPALRAAQDGRRRAGLLHDDAGHRDRAGQAAAAAQRRGREAAGHPGTQRLPAAAARRPGADPARPGGGRHAQLRGARPRGQLSVRPDPGHRQRRRPHLRPRELVIRAGCWWRPGPGWPVGRPTAW